MLYERFLSSVRITSIHYEELLQALRRISKNIKDQHREISGVYLFGSFALGDYTPESDVDILIICEHSNIPFLLRSDTFVDYFRSIPLDVNLLVYTQKEFNRMKAEKNFFKVPVDQEARNLLD